MSEDQNLKWNPDGCPTRPGSVLTCSNMRKDFIKTRSRLIHCRVCTGNTICLQNLWRWAPTGEKLYVRNVCGGKKKPLKKMHKMFRLSGLGVFNLRQASCVVKASQWSQWLNAFIKNVLLMYIVRVILEALLLKHCTCYDNVMALLFRQHLVQDHLLPLTANQVCISQNKCNKEKNKIDKII